jgi:hypothetical protein
MLKQAAIQETDEFIENHQACSEEKDEGEEEPPRNRR